MPVSRGILRGSGSHTLEIKTCDGDVCMILIPRVHHPSHWHLHVVRRISKNKWPQEKQLQWLKSVPDPAVDKPDVKHAQQPEPNVIRLWKAGAEKNRG